MGRIRKKWSCAAVQRDLIVPNWPIFKIDRRAFKSPTFRGPSVVTVKMQPTWGHPLRRIHYVRTRQGWRHVQSKVSALHPHISHPRHQPSVMWQVDCQVSTNCQMSKPAGVNYYFICFCNLVRILLMWQAQLCITQVMPIEDVSLHWLANLMVHSDVENIKTVM